MITHLNKQYYFIFLTQCCQEQHYLCLLLKNHSEKTCGPLIVLYLFWLVLPLPFSMRLTANYFTIQHLKCYKLPQLSYFPKDIQCRFEFSNSTFST